MSNITFVLTNFKAIRAIFFQKKVKKPWLCLWKPLGSKQTIGPNNPGSSIWPFGFRRGEPHPRLRSSSRIYRLKPLCSFNADTPWPTAPYRRSRCSNIRFKHLLPSCTCRAKRVAICSLPLIRSTKCAIAKSPFYRRLHLRGAASSRNRRNANLFACDKTPPLA